jgi:hypothetical protein
MVQKGNENISLLNASKRDAPREEILQFEKKYKIKIK